MASGSFIIRMSKEQHLMLQKSARRQARSLNELCVQRAVLPSAAEMLSEDLQRAVFVLSNLFSERLLGVVIFGSWAKGQATKQSDIDLMVVLSGEEVITRSIYTKFEAQMNDVGKLEPHFVNLPNPLQRVTGLWAEVSMTGLVIMDPTLQIQRHLNFIREKIAAGEIVQKRLHGQNYWIHSEVA